MWRQFQQIHKIDENIIKVVEEEFKFNNITKVQNVVIPEFLKSKDVIVKACTGSGKTLSYLIPLFQKLINHKKENGKEQGKILAVIMLPSRELSIQVFNVFLKFITKFDEEYKFTYNLLIGGKKIQKDLDKLNMEIPNIIIATPGRLFDLEDKLHLSFKDVQMLILDEADKMLELGYEKKVTGLIEKFQKQRRTGLFSATMNSQIENLIKVGMRNPVFIDVKVNIKGDSENANEEIFVKEDEFNSNSYYQIVELNSNKQIMDKKEQLSQFSQETPTQLIQYYKLFDNIKFKFLSMIKMIKKRVADGKMHKMMIFFATCNAVDYFSIVLPKLFEKLDQELGLEEEKIFSRISLFKLHSKISQKKRKKEYKTFLAAESGILLTTDLSARGIDVPNVDLILQYDPPKNEELYIHRVGRTARVGSDGQSIIFLSKNEESFIKYMKMKNIVLNKIDDNEFENSSKIDGKLNAELYNWVKEINISDKWIYEKAVKTFVSYIRFYTEHDLKYIFDIKMFDLGNFANSLSLLRLPRLKEILGKKIENFVQDTDIDPKTLNYVSTNIAKQMEVKEEKIKIIQEAKQAKIAEEKENFYNKQQEHFSKKKEKKNRTRKEKKDAKIRNAMKDWDELAEDQRLYKKFKKGKISKEEYDKLTMKI